MSGECGVVCVCVVLNGEEDEERILEERPFRPSTLRTINFLILVTLALLWA